MLGTLHDAELEYAGPRPDEELLDAVRVEATVGEEASVERIYEMVQAGEDVNQRSVCGYTPLAVASAAGAEQLVALLLERRADVAPGTSHRGETPLHHAARGGHRVVCQLLAPLAKAAGVIDAPSMTGWPPVHLAAAGGHANVVTVLFKNNAAVDCVNDVLGRGTAVHVATRMGAVDTVEALVDREAQPDLPDAAGFTPLHYAAARCDQRCVSLLLRSRADANRPEGSRHRTPLDMLPAKHEQRERVFNLLSAYARPQPRLFKVDNRFEKQDDRDIHF